MQAELSPTTAAQGYATREITKPPSWHGMVACDLLFNNLTTGLYLVAALCELVAPRVFAPVARAAYPLALVLLIVDLLCLVLDLGDPLRFHHMLRVFKPISPMSLGTWFLTSYSFPLALIVAIDILRAIGVMPHAWATLEWVRKVAVVLGLVPALGSAVYKGVLLSTSSQPGWKDARWMGGYLVNSALLLGCAEMIVLANLSGRERAVALLRTAFGVMLVLNLIPLGLMIADVRGQLARIYTREQLIRIAIFTVGVGTLFPLCLVLAGRSLPVILGAVTCSLLGSVAIRFLIIKLPHTPSSRTRDDAQAIVGAKACGAA